MFHSGTNVESLSDIAEREGFPKSYADEWVLQAAAVTGTPDSSLYVLPVPGAGRFRNSYTVTHQRRSLRPLQELAKPY